jgi:hypothetical protein
MLRRNFCCRGLRGTVICLSPPTKADIAEVLNNPSMFPFTLDQITQYRRDGYLIARDVFKPEVLRRYDQDVRHAATVRGDSMLPNPDESKNRVDIHVRSKEKREVDELEKQGKPVPQELREKKPNQKFGNQRMIIKYRNKRAFIRGYKAAVEKRRRIAAARGYHVPEDDIERQLKAQDEAEAEAKRRKAAGEPDPPENATPTLDPNDAKVGFDQNTGEYLTQDELQERGREYVNSPEFKQRVDKKMHVTEVNDFFAQMGQAWVHLWHGDDALRGQVTGPVGATLARAACELGGCTKARLFTDQATLKKKWNNAHPIHCMAPFVDFIDMRAVTATLVLPPTPLDRQRGAFVFLPGSHEVLRRISDDGRDTTLFRSMPASWDVGEWVRAIPELRKIQPREEGIGPNDVLFAHTHMGFSHLPNYSVDEPLTHTLFMMPDGVVFSGAKTTWMTTSRDGPLRHYEAGQPLRDDAVFPLLYNALDDAV